MVLIFEGFVLQLQSLGIFSNCWDCCLQVVPCDLLLTRDATALAVSAGDRLAQVISLQELLQISLEQLDAPELPLETRKSRVQLLLSYYLDVSRSPLEELTVQLQEILQQQTSVQNGCNPVGAGVFST